jgi:hypothetical protein
VSENITAPKASHKAQMRADLVKRLFAVTLSVGVASQIIKIVFTGHTLDHQLQWTPVLAQWPELLLLLISLIIVVTSWEGYLGAIEGLPLEDWQRFYIDILLVLSYLILTLCCQLYDDWFAVHLIIFILYLAWDHFRARLPDYQRQMRDNPRPRSQRSMVITMIWLAFFGVLYLLKLCFPFFAAPFGFAVIALAALAGVILYRVDKIKRWSWPEKTLYWGVPIGLLIALPCLAHIFQFRDLIRG